MDLLERFERLFPDAQIHCLTGDREFVGQEWCSFLLLPNAMPFRLWLRHSDRIGRRVYVVATRLEDGELLILATGHDLRAHWRITV